VSMNTTSFVRNVTITPQTSGYLVSLQHKWPCNSDDRDENGNCANYDHKEMEYYHIKHETYACNDAAEVLDVVSQYIKADGHEQSEYFADANE